MADVACSAIASRDVLCHRLFIGARRTHVIFEVEAHVWLLRLCDEGDEVAQVDDRLAIELLQLHVVQVLVTQCRVARQYLHMIKFGNWHQVLGQGGKRSALYIGQAPGITWPYAACQLLQNTIVRKGLGEMSSHAHSN